MFAITSSPLTLVAWTVHAGVTRIVLEHYRLCANECDRLTPCPSPELCVLQAVATATKTSLLDLQIRAAFAFWSLESHGLNVLAPPRI